MAHDYAMLHMVMDRYKDIDDLEMVQWANDYVDALEADADKREKADVEIKRAEMRELLNADNTFVEKEGMHFDDVNFEPDWSQAPRHDVVAWDINEHGQARWIASDNGYYLAPSFDYKGDWRESLRKRPE